MKTCNRCGSDGPFYKAPNSICKECHQVNVKRWRANNQAKVQVHQRKSRLAAHGLTQAQYDAQYEVQEGSCAICAKYQDVLHVDHCHTTGVNRGLLCLLCNTAIGKMKDSPQVLRNAIYYLESYV